VSAGTYNDVSQLNGRGIPFVNNVTCLGVVAVHRRMTWRHHIERSAAKTLRTYVRTYSPFKSGRLSTNIKLMLYNALIRPVTTHACPTWEYAADGHHLKLQRLENRVIRSAGNLDRCTSVREVQVAFLTCVTIQIMQDTGRSNAKSCNSEYTYLILDKGKPGIRSLCGLNLAAVRLTTVQLTNCSFSYMQNLLRKPSLRRDLCSTSLNIT
jgi:hypothetical protein